MLALTLGGCATTNRIFKSAQSEFGNGLHREVTVFSRDGDVIFQDSGKIDVAVSETRIKYINEQGKVVIFYMGNSASVLVEEK